MSRPRLYSDDRIQTTVRLPRELYDRLHSVADERVVGVSLLITKAIEAYLAQLVKP